MDKGVKRGKMNKREKKLIDIVAEALAVYSEGIYEGLPSYRINIRNETRQSKTVELCIELTITDAEEEK